MADDYDSKDSCGALRQGRGEKRAAYYGGFGLGAGNDVTSPVAIKEFEKAKLSKVFDNKKIALVMDHFTPNKDIKSAEQVKIVREFANKYDIKNFYDVGEMGVEHALLPEKGLVVSGDLVIGADSPYLHLRRFGAFSTEWAHTDLACAGMAYGKAWFKVPAAIKFKSV